MSNTILEILNSIRPEVDFESSINFIEDGYLDSLDIIILVAELEKNFNISISGELIIPENFSSITSIQTLVNKFSD